jgi:nicotinamide-nucleotide amidase
MNTGKSSLNFFRNPRIEIITIGREILDGRVLDTNSIFMAEVLKARGLVPRWAQRVDDQVDRIIEAFQIASKRSDFVLCTGGLGPTSDDLTAESFAQFLEEECVLRPDALELVKSFFDRIGRPMIDIQKKQALLPRSAKIFPNPEGSAPGFWGEKNNARFFFMPGVPREMRRMMKEQVLPFLPQVPGYRSYNWATQFTSEGELQQRLLEIHKKLPREFEITYRTRFPENHIGLHGPGFDEKFSSVFEQLLNEISTTLGDDVFCQGNDLKNLEEVVLDLLMAQQISVGSVESCTGGLIAHHLSNIAGSSSVYLGSWITYANEAKVALGVNPETLRQFGAVSPETAKELALSGLKALRKMKTRGPLYCLSTTGIAGPSGGSPEKPVGLCYVGLAFSANENTESVELFSDEIRGRPLWPRIENKNLFSQKALDLLRRKLIPSNH